MSKYLTNILNGVFFLNRMHTNILDAYQDELCASLGSITSNCYNFQKSIKQPLSSLIEWCTFSMKNKF